jgi:hypothetical protein
MQGIICIHLDLVKWPTGSYRFKTLKHVVGKARAEKIAVDWALFKPGAIKGIAGILYAVIIWGAWFIQ